MSAFALCRCLPRDALALQSLAMGWVTVQMLQINLRARNQAVPPPPTAQGLMAAGWSIQPQWLWPNLSSAHGRNHWCASCDRKACRAMAHLPDKASAFPCISQAERLSSTQPCLHGCTSRSLWWAMEPRTAVVANRTTLLAGWLSPVVCLFAPTCAACFSDWSPAGCCPPPAAAGCPDPGFTDCWQSEDTLFQCFGRRRPRFRNQMLVSFLQHSGPAVCATQGPHRHLSSTPLCQCPQSHAHQGARGLVSAPQPYTLHAALTVDSQPVSCCRAYASHLQVAAVRCASRCLAAACTVLWAHLSVSRFCL